MFREMEDHKERLGVVDYSVSQVTLEQVYMYMYTSPLIHASVGILSNN